MKMISMAKRDKEGMNWNKFINDMMRPENRKLLLIYLSIICIAMLILINFLASFGFILIILGVLIFRPKLGKIFKRKRI